MSLGGTAGLSLWYNITLSEWSLHVIRNTAQYAYSFIATDQLPFQVTRTSKFINSHKKRDVSLSKECRTEIEGN